MKKGFYRIPNRIFDYKLSPAAFYLYITLSGRYWFTSSINLSLNKLSEQCSMCIATIRTAICELVEKELLVVTEQYGEHNRRMRNQYTLRRLPEAFAKLDKNILDLDIDNSTFMIFCYLLVKSNHAGMAFPSIQQMKAELGLSHTTIIKKIAILNDLGVVIKERKITRAGDYGHNNHTLITLHTRMCLMFLLTKLQEGRQLLK